MIDAFVERGNQLAKSRNLMLDDPEYAAALALVSVHCAIALNDALLIRFTGTHQISEDHTAAANRSEVQCRQRRVRTDGLKHLRQLLAAKSRVSYGSERLTSDVAMKLAIASERFEAWVRPLLK